MKSFKELTEANLHDKIKNHPAVQSYEANYGEHFVNLKPGYHWSGQRSFGDETAGKVWKLLKGVTKTDV